MGLPTRDDVKKRIEALEKKLAARLEAINADAKAKKLTAVDALQKEIDAKVAEAAALRKAKKEKAKAARSEIDAETRTARAEARKAHRVAVSSWEKVLKALDAETVSSDESPSPEETPAESTPDAEASTPDADAPKPAADEKPDKSAEIGEAITGKL